MGGLEEQHGQRPAATTASAAPAATAVRLLSAQCCHRHRLVRSERHPSVGHAQSRESERTQRPDALPGVRRAGRLRRRIDVVVLQLVGRQRREDAAQERRHNGERQRQDHHVQVGIVELRTPGQNKACATRPYAKLKLQTAFTS